MGLLSPLSFLSLQFKLCYLLSKLLDRFSIRQLHLWTPETLKYLPEHSQVNLLNELLCNSLAEPFPWFSIISYTAGSNTSKVWPQTVLSVLRLTMPDPYLSVLSSSYTWEIRDKIYNFCDFTSCMAPTISLTISGQISSILWVSSQKPPLLWSSYRLFRVECLLIFTPWKLRKIQYFS